MENRLNNDPKSINENEVLNNRLNNARKEGVTKGSLVTGIISVVLLLGLGFLGYTHYNKEKNNLNALMEDQRFSFTREINQRDSTLNDWLSSFNEIENNLRLIKEKEKLISVNTAGDEVSKDKRNQILEDIRSINTLLDENKKKIAQLSSQLKNSGTQVTALQARIASLEESIKTYEAEISELKTNLASKNFEIGQLNETMVALNETLNEKQEIISNQTYRLNQAFLVSGTYKDLKDKGLLSKEGGFLGIGRREALQEDFSDSLFKEVDITRTTTIPVNSKSMKLITEHPSASYEVVKESENMVGYIAIKDPDEFWKLTRYAVIELKK